MRAIYPNTDRERLMYEAVREVIGQMIDDLLVHTRRDSTICDRKPPKISAMPRK